MDLVKYEARVMHIGAWKNFIDLEDSLTLDELFEIYASIVEEEAEQFKRDASLQGIDIPDAPTEDGVEDDFTTRLSNRLEQEEKDSPTGNIKFGQGQGYRVVGG